ncbi:MAG: hypothetical protein ACETWE_04325, partial [Candidatus Bathyarchaeia archaeon]
MRTLSVKDGLSKALRVEFFIGPLSLIWFLLRTGTRPTRVVYPCQRAAAANVYVWLTTCALPFLAIPQRLTGTGFGRRKIVAVTAILLVVTVGSLSLWELYKAGTEEPEEVIELTLEGRLAKVEPASDIFVVAGTNGYDGGFVELADLMGQYELSFYKSDVTGKNKDPDGLIAKDDVIIIKVNSQWDQRGGTNTDL